MLREGKREKCIYIRQKTKRWHTMMFNKHGSFYLRKSWPMKGLRAIKEEETIFSPQNELLAVDTLGIGRVMVISLRYWMSAIGLAEEGRDSNGRITLKPTELGKIIEIYDPFFQSIGTAWLLHRNLVKNEEEATTWYWFFNEFDKKIFTQEEFLKSLKAYVLLHGETIADSSLKRDFDCLKKTYERAEFSDISNYIEEGIISYFSQLDLIKQEGKKTYRKLTPIDKKLPEEVILYSILDDIADNQDQVSIKELYEREKYIGKVYNLSYRTLMNKLEDLERKGYIEIYSRFGHNHIEIKEKDKKTVLKNYYRKVM